MKIELTENRETLEIKDGLRIHYYWISLLFILNLLNAIINNYNISKSGLSTIQIIWIVLGIILIVGLVYMNLKLSTSQQIKLRNIKAIREKKILGKKRLSIELKNGKRRNLIGFKSKSEISELKQLFNEIGLSVK